MVLTEGVQPWIVTQACSFAFAVITFGGQIVRNMAKGRISKRR